jgi:hypothetical protein
MLLFIRIENAFLLLSSLSNYLDEQSPISRRLLATGIASELYQIASQLSEINERMDYSISIEDACLDASRLERHQINEKRLFDEKMYMEGETNDADINKLVDLFPLSDKDYSFTQEDAKRFKTGMRYICSDANISPRNLVYALQKGISDIKKNLISIDHKKHHIKDNQWEDFWNDFYLRDDDLFIERAMNDYEEWKEEYDWHNIQVLMDKRTQEILKLLKSGVFKADNQPVGREITNSVIKIPEEALENGTEVPEDINIECARFSKYVTFKEDILQIDYKKLGRYVYRHYGDLHDEDWDNLIYFENILYMIHQDMADCNPKLKKYLKFNEDEQLDEVLNKALGIIKCCNSLLKEKVDSEFLTNYLSDAFYGDMKVELQSSLKGQSKYTVICRILGMIKTSQKVFKIETTSADLAKALASIVEKPKEDSLKRYIDQGSSDHVSKLSKWTNKYITNHLGTESERLFVKISQE